MQKNRRFVVVALNYGIKWEVNTYGQQFDSIWGFMRIPGNSKAYVWPCRYTTLVQKVCKKNSMKILNDLTGISGISLYRFNSRYGNLNST